MPAADPVEGDSEKESASADDADDTDDEQGDTPAADLDDETDKGTPDTDSGSTPPEKTGFQVELTYNGKMVKLSGLKGGESHDLAALLHELGIDGELTEATGNADELFNVTRGESGMRFNTLMAFGDPYQLVVTVDGVQYIIDVTDDGNTILADGSCKTKLFVK